MLLLKICEKNWVSIKDVEFDSDILTPYWCKMENGNIVMAAFYSNGYSTGFARCYVDDDGLKIDGSKFYILKNALVQEVIFE